MQLNDKYIERFSELLIDKVKQIEVNYETPWFQNSKVLPKNLDGRPYAGVNQFFLSLVAAVDQYKLKTFATFNRLKEEGISVKAGEKGYLIAYVGRFYEHKETNERIKEKEYNELSNAEKANYKAGAFTTYSNVFNIDQTNAREVKPELIERLEREQEVEVQARTDLSHSPIDSVVGVWRCPIHHDVMEKAYYVPLTDEIHLPPKELFKSNEAYYSTLLHEMAHSTLAVYDRPFGDKHYAREELVAEFSAALTGSQYGIDKTMLPQNAIYIKGWLEKKDPEFLRSIINDVANASRYLTQSIEDANKLDKDRVEEAKVGLEESPHMYLELYSRPHLLTSAEARNIRLPQDLRDKISERETLLMSYATANTIPLREERAEALLKKEAEIKDKLYNLIKDNYPDVKLPAYVPLETQRAALSTFLDQSQTTASYSNLYTSKFGSLSTDVVFDNTEDRRNIFQNKEIEYTLTSQDKIQTTGKVRLKEGYDVTDRDTDYLNTHMIPYDITPSGRVYVDSSAENVHHLLLEKGDKIAPLFGVSYQHRLIEQSLPQRVAQYPNLNDEEKQRILGGETISKSNIHYYIDKETNQIRQVRSSELEPILKPSLRPEESVYKILSGSTIEYKSDDLKYKSQLDLNDTNLVSRYYKVHMDKDYNRVPTATSPDADKVRYLALVGARAIDEIWGRGGVNLDRDTFLQKYDLVDRYQSYISTQDPIRSKAESETIREQFRLSTQSSEVQQSSGLKR